MLIKVSQILFSLILAVSALTPLVVDLFPTGEDISILLDLDEEDKKESKKEFELKDLFFSENNTEGNYEELLTYSFSNIYKFKIISFPLEVISPPPEMNLFS